MQVSTTTAVLNVVATHCCVCRAPLTDAESIEHSIGPVCSRRYYNPQHTPTPEQVQAALGLLAASGLPDVVIDGVLALSNDDKANARGISNLLVKYASLNYDNRTEVLKCSGIMRALGYIELADKLETDRTSAQITIKGDIVEVFAPDQYEIRRALRKIPNIQPLTAAVEADGPVIADADALPVAPRQEQVKRGRKLGWVIPKAGLAHLECIFGVHLTGELVSYGGGDLRKTPYKSQFDLYQFTNPPAPVQPPAPVSSATPAPVAPSAPKCALITLPNGKIAVRSPYSARFVAELKVAVPYQDRRWLPADKLWEVTSRHLNVIRTLIQNIYHESV
jgi:hypothetical protein